MRVLMISGDPQALDRESAVHARLSLQAASVEWLEVFVRSSKADTPLRGKGIVRGFAGPKLQVMRAMLRAAHDLQVDVVTSQDPFYLGFIAWRIARRTHCRLQLQVHTDVCSLAYLRGHPLRYSLARFLLRRADTVRAVSERVKENIVESGIHTPISVLPIFIDREAIAQAPAADLHRSYPQFDTIILAAARLEEEKNLSAIIAAMPAILRAYPRSGLLIAGEGSQRHALEEQVARLSLVDHILFLGHRSDLFALYKGADLFLAATARYEGYGAAIVEALAAGCPVVSRDVGIAAAAGATIAEGSVAEEAIDILTKGQRGHLNFALLSPLEWSAQWLAGLPTP